MNAKMKYVVGFLLSVVLTVSAYAAVVTERLAASSISLVIVVLAIVQLFVQLVFFLHLGDESRPRWKLWALVGTLITLLIVVFGSIWIMKNLDYNMMPPMETDRHMIKESNKGF